MFMSSIEVIKDFVNDTDVIKFKRNDQSRIIDACDLNTAKIIQTLSKTMSCKSIAQKLNLSVKDVKNYIKMAS